MESIAGVAAHLSPTAQRFLEYVTGDPALTRPLHHAAHGEHHGPVQSWPTFVGASKLAEIRRATVELTSLLKSIPERLFGNDPRRTAAAFGRPGDAGAAIILEPPNGLDAILVRNDYIDTPEGLQCLEINAGLIGGWKHRYFERRFLAHPVIARFLAAEGIAPYYRDSVAEMMRFVVDHNLGKPTAAGGELNVAIAMTRRRPAAPGQSEEDDLSRTYRAVLERGGSGLTGQAVLAAGADLAVRQNQIWYRNRWPVQALVMMSPEPLPPAVFRAFKSGRLSLYNGPVERFVNDKRILALLSEHADSPLFTAEERQVLARHLPWTRAVGPGATTYRGETAALPDLLLAHRETLVLKPSTGHEGRGVTVGRLTPPEAWAGLVAEAVAKGGWLAQERIESRPYLYQCGEQGYGRHDVVWGTFCFGDGYGGAFLRMVPSGTEAVINSFRGAVEGFVYEV